MTIEEKARAYDEAKSIMEKYLKSGNAGVIAENTIKKAFPELGENEDERIRKELIRILKGEISFTSEKANEKYIAWLEKQGEKLDEWKEGDIVRHGDILALVINGRRAMKQNGEQITIQYPDEWVKANSKERKYFFEEFEKQGEQRPAKVEPKFNEGDWVVQGHNILKIRCVGNTYYCFETVGGYADDMLISEIDSHFHLWTINDAKDGDVLATKEGNPFIYDKNRYNNGLAYYYAGLGVNKELTLKSPHHMLGHFGELRSVSPATKKQCDLLFQKMHDAGYEWDVEKKELKKLEQKPAWNREDEQNLNAALGYIDDEYLRRWLKDAIYNRYENPSEWSKEDEDLFDLLHTCVCRCISDPYWEYSKRVKVSKEIIPFIDWLKSLRPYKQWKPTQEQLDALKWQLENINENSWQYKATEELYNQLNEL